MQINRYLGKSTQLAKVLRMEKRDTEADGIGTEYWNTSMITKLFLPFGIGYISISTGNFIIRSPSFFDSMIRSMWLNDRVLRNWSFLYHYDCLTRSSPSWTYSVTISFVLADAMGSLFLPYTKWKGVWWLDDITFSLVMYIHETLQAPFSRYGASKKFMGMVLWFYELFYLGKNNAIESERLLKPNRSRFPAKYTVYIELSYWSKR